MAIYLPKPFYPKFLKMKYLSTSFIFLLLAFTAYTQNNMTLLSNWDGSTIGYNDVWGYVDDYDNEYAIVGTRTDTYFIDITNPTNPVFVATFTGSFSNGTVNIVGENNTWRDFKTFKRFAYGVCDSCNEGLQIFDLSDIHNGNVTKINQINTVFGSCHNIYVDPPNGRLYAVGTNTQNNGVHIFDLEADPANPTLLSSVALDGGYIHDIFVQNNIGYCSSGNDGMFVIDFTNPNSPVTIASLVTGGYNHSAWIYEDGTKILYAEEVPQGLPLGVIDLTNVANDDLVIINTFRDAIEPTADSVTYHNPYIVDDYAIIASYQDGLTIFDISNPLDTNRVAFYDTYPNNNDSYSGYLGCWGSYPFLPSNNLLASDRSTGLYVLSTSIPLTTDCYNGTTDIFERGVDCGGFCKPCATCNDGIKNGDEEDVDCGGTECDPCFCYPTLNLIGTESDTTHHSYGTIYSIATVPSNTNVNYYGNEICLLPTFEVELNAEFLADISSCTTPIIAPTVAYRYSPKGELITSTTDNSFFELSYLKGSGILTIEINLPTEYNVSETALQVTNISNQVLHQYNLSNGLNIFKLNMNRFDVDNIDSLKFRLSDQMNSMTKTISN